MNRLRFLVPLGLGLAVATCRDALGPRGGGAGGLARVAVAPILPSSAALADFGLTIDRVRIVVVRPVADTLADTTAVLPPDADFLDLDLRVPLLARRESLSVTIEALAGSIPLFSGTSMIEVRSDVARPEPVEIPVTTYVGPGAGVDSIVVLPPTPFIYLNDSLRFQIQAFQAGAPVTQFYVSWSSSDTTVARINGYGVLRAPASRTAVRVRARTPSGASDSVTATFVPLPTELVSIAGGGQSGIVGTALAVPLEVEVRAADGLGVGGVAVRFRALAGGAAVADSLIVSDTAGRARTVATLGSLSGTYTFEASTQGLAGSPITFDATALAGAPAQLLAAAGDGQLATVATAVPTAPAVRVNDGAGNPVAGVSVTFTVASGGGGVTGGTQTTDATGLATLGAWTLGPLAGTNTLTASAGALSRTFTATGAAGAATQLVATAGDLQSAVVGTPVATDPAVQALDQFGNPVPGAAVTFTVSGGGGSITGAAQLTNASGIATVGGWTLGTAVGANTLTATVAGVTPVTFTANATAGTAAAIVKVAGDVQSAVVNAAVAVNPQVRLLDQFGNPVAGASLTFAVTGGGGSVAGAAQTTDTAGVATLGGWTLGTAVGENAVTATAGALSATFTATATAGAPTQIAALAGNGQIATVGTTLATAPAVVVRDQFNNPVPGVGVTFAASAGGSVTGALQTTDSAGAAAVGSWTLDTLAGTNTLTATSGGLTTTFSASGLAGPATQLLKVAGDSLTAVVGTPVGTPPAVRALDQYGNPVSNLGVTFAVTGGAGSVVGPSPTTNASGLAAVGGWTLDTLAGANTLTATAGVLSAAFTATGQAAAPSQLIKMAGDSQTGVVNAPLPVAPTVRLTDAYGNPVAGDTVGFFVLVDGGFVATPNAVTDSTGLASAGAWTLANFVTQNVLQAGVPTAAAVAPVRFTATAIPDAPAQLLRVSSDRQTALAGQAVSTPPVVQVVDQYFNGVPGVSVTFTLTGALLGSLTPSTATTDSTGVARVTTWTLDSLPGLNTLDADAPGLIGSPITFNATGVTTTATTIALSGGDVQSGIVGRTLATPYAVAVRDASGLPVQNVQVAWTVGPEGGSISPATSLTDTTGTATALRTLGGPAGTQTAAASVGGLAGSPVTFTATALADTAFQIVSVAGDSQSAPVGTAVPIAPSVRVMDAFGNPVAGILVGFTPDTLGGIVTGGAQTTDSAGVATVGSWTLGGVVGTQTLTVSAGSLTPATFTATATAGTPASLAIVQGNLQTATVNTAVPVPPAVVVRDAGGNPVAGVQVSFTPGAASGAVTGGTATTDTTGVAVVGSWTLGTLAGPDTLVASVAGVTPVAFTSTGLADVAAQIFKQAGDSQTATVNTAVATQPTARVTDQYGNPVGGQSVTWAVASGGGSLGTPTTVTSDAAGIATAPVWTLGTAAGSNTLSASATGLSGSPLTFTATGTAGAATQMAVNGGDNQSATVGTAVATPPSVILRDQFNNRVAGVVVTFSVTLGGGTATGATDTTDATGIAAMGSWTLGTIAGTNTLGASAAGVPSVTFSATGLAGAPVRLAFLTEPTRALAGDTIAPPVRVAIQDQFGNTVPTASDVVTVGLGVAPDPAAKLGDTLAVASVNGVAQFADLAIDSAGIGYTLVATTPKLAGSAETKPFDVGGVIAAIPVVKGLGPVAAALNPQTGRAYVPGASAVSVLDIVKNAEVAVLTGFELPFGVAVNGTTDQIYVSSAAGVVVIDGPSNTSRVSIPVGTGAKGVAVDEATNQIYVAVAGDPQKGAPALVPIDGAKDAVISTAIVALPGAGVGVAFNPNTGLVYVAIPTLQEVVVVDPVKAAVVAEIPVGKGAYGVAVDVRTKLLYVTNRDENTVFVIDVSSPDPQLFKEVARVAVGFQPEGLGVDADRGIVYVGNSGESTVSLIEGVKFTVFATLVVGPTPKAAAVDPGSGRVYVPTFGDDAVRVVQP
ncbi:MAG: hypothetical protein Q8Q14_07235 [Gemmatimonadales bacterium]|nr:hypothetical protein [Gemmatimonadales bacterium]